MAGHVLQKRWRGDNGGPVGMALPRARVIGKPATPALALAQAPQKNKLRAHLLRHLALYFVATSRTSYFSRECLTVNSNLRGNKGPGNPPSGFQHFKICKKKQKNKVDKISPKHHKVGFLYASHLNTRNTYTSGNTNVDRAADRVQLREWEGSQQ